MSGMVPRNFTDLAEAYRDYGFVYCFSCSALDRGISRPWDYSEQRMDQIEVLRSAADHYYCLHY